MHKTVTRINTIDMLLNQLKISMGICFWRLSRLGEIGQLPARLRGKAGSGMPVGPRVLKVWGGSGGDVSSLPR
jgi:hypothetical protein